MGLLKVQIFSSRVVKGWGQFPGAFDHAAPQDCRFNITEGCRAKRSRHGHHRCSHQVRAGLKELRDAQTSASTSVLDVQ